VSVNLWASFEPRHLYLVKNLRGIVYFSAGIDVEKEINWLKKKFRYRNLGISETLGIKNPWKKLIVLPRIVENRALDSILQASKYLCPLVILKHESLKDLKEIIIAELRTDEHLSDKDLKFNLRLVNYSITDFYLESIELGKMRDLSGRKRLALNDLKRFWRVKRSDKGNTLIVYLDPLLSGIELNNPIFLSIIPSIVLGL